MKLAFLTGNSMSELSNRFLRWLISELCHKDALALLEQFHFFSNSGGVYFHFSTKDENIIPLLEKKPCQCSEASETILRTLTLCDATNTGLIRPRFINEDYIERTHILPDEAEEIKRVLTECAGSYSERIEKDASALNAYDLGHVTDKANGCLIHPFVDTRPVVYGSEDHPSCATVQITLKPILSFRHGVTEEERTRLFERDLRTWLIAKIQDIFDARGLGHYIARPGGRSSIDVTLEKLDKAYALEFLIDHLNIQGHARQGQKFGANAIYFGDEVIVGGGNDYPVTRIPGLLVLAVNAEKELVPFLSRVFVPSSILEGPDATADVLAELNRIARALLKRCEQRKGDILPRLLHSTALDELKIKVFTDRIYTKIEELKTKRLAGPEEWQILHVFVTLMHRRDSAARQLLSVLVEELDAIMTQAAMSRRSRGKPERGIGVSHADG
jgi:hydroxymethylpyrimidine pyrophosphatase-like HAD family hydrolase